MPADRDVLVARGVARLLTAEAEAVPPGTGLLPALARVARAGPIEQLSLQVRVDGAPESGDGIARAVSAALAARAERHPDEGALRISDEVAAQAAIALDVDSAGDRVRFTAVVEGAGQRLAVASAGDWPLPGRASLLPPVVALVVALAWGRTLLALFVAIWVGAGVRALDQGAGLAAPFVGLVDVFGVYLRREIVDTFRIEIIGFIVALVAMVGVMSRAGGVSGLVDRLAGAARSVRRALIMTWGAGLLIFFDDYANCMLVGSTMRPLTDRLRISREKLAYVVDSTAAPVAGLSLLSTWVAFQVSVYSAQLPAAGIQASGFSLLVQSVPYRFYCWLTLGFVALVIVTGRDFGPMAAAETRAHTTGALVRPGSRPPVSDALASIEPAPDMPRDWWTAAIPLALTVFVTVLRIFVDGGGFALLQSDAAALTDLEGWAEVLQQGSGAAPIFAGAISGLLAAAWLAGSNPLRLGIAAGLASLALAGGSVAEAASGLGDLASRYAAPLVLFVAAGGVVGALARAGRLATPRPHLGFRELRRSAFSSAGTLAFAVILLFEAWMIGSVCADLSTADYLVAQLTDTLPPGLLPLLLFVAGCAVAFATGSSWSTMSILLPNAVPLAAALGADTALGATGMVVLCISAVLEGSIFGDHCSPISDTTVLSSVASGSDHLDHVRTQAPYALAVAGAAVVCGYLPILWVPAWSPGLALASGAALLAGLLFWRGRRVREALPASP